VERQGWKVKEGARDKDWGCTGISRNRETGSWSKPYGLHSLDTDLAIGFHFLLEKRGDRKG